MSTTFKPGHYNLILTIPLGVPRDLAHQMLGSYWTLKIYKDGELWGFYLKCLQIPSLNIWISFAEGEEQCIEHEIFGRSKVCT